MLLPWWAIQHTGAIDWLAWLAFLGAVAVRGGVPVRAAPLRARAAADRARLLGRRVEADLVRALPLRRQAGGRRRALPGHPWRPRDWIDRAVPAGADVAVLWTGRSDRFTVNQNEFFNRRVGQVYYTARPTPGGDRRAAGRGRPSGRVPCGTPTVAPSGPATSSPTARSSPNAVAVARDPRARDDGVEGRRAARPREDDASTGIYPNDTWSGPARHLDARALPRRLADRLALGRRAAASRRQHRSTASTGEQRPRRPEPGRDAARPARRRADGTLHGRVRRRADRRPERGDPGQHRRPRARGALQRVRLRAVRIAFDVSPLSHPPTGVGNYIRGSLAGLLEAAGRRARGRRVRADEPARARRGSGRRSTGSTSSCARGRCPPRTRCAPPGAWLGHPAAERLLGPFDVLHFTDWMYPPQRAGVRATTIHDLVPLRFPEWTTKRTQAMHGRKYANAARTLRRRSSSTRPSPAATRRSCSASTPTRIRVAPPGRQGRVHRRRRRRPTSARRTSSPSRRSSRARTCRRSSRRTGCSAATSLLAVAGGEGWGEQPVLDDPRVRRLGFVSDEELARALPRRRGRRLPVAVRGLRDADRRGDGLRHAGRRVGARVDGRGVAATPRSAPTRTIRQRSPPRSSRRSPSASALVPPASRTPRGSPGAPRARRCSRGYEAAR